MSDTIKCKLCSDKLKFKEFTQMKCCKIKCHKWCMDQCNKYIHKCPMCKDKLQFLIPDMMEYYHTCSDKVTLFDNIKNNMERDNGSSSIYRFYLPRGGDFIHGLECDIRKYKDSVEIIKEMI